jgi:HlyD family secretion protein
VGEVRSKNKKKGKTMKSKKTIVIILVLVAAAAGVIAFTNRKPPVQWRTAEVRFGTLNVQVTATGSIEPRTTVQVGTQVSGTLSKLYADFNATVKKGQVLAVLDTTFLHAAVQDARATLARSVAQARLAGQTYRRTAALFEKGLVAQADLDAALADSQTTAAAVSSAQAQVERARINLKYATIISPINGTVINRQVDVGQTVAASFNTPTLFTIADDLTRMQVQASIDEADIGEVKLNQKAQFTVDAYPDRTFDGTVSDIRLQPTVVQNVVTYTVIIDVPNNDRSLFPGMTANITINVKALDSVLIVPAAALKFTPPEGKGKGRHGKIRGSMPGMTGTGRGAGRPDSAAAAGGQRQKRAERVFVMADNTLRPARVTALLTNGENTAVQGTLTPGQKVVVGTLSPSKAKASSQTGQPFGMGGPRRF